MTWLNDLPVQRKLGFAMLLTSTVALIVACAVFLTVEYLGYRSSLLHTVATLARITADNSATAIALSDQKSATQNLEALQAEPQITAAILYDTDGRVFARFAPFPDKVLKSSATDPVGVRLEHGYIIEVEPVVKTSRQLGTLYLQANMAGIYERMQRYAVSVLAALILSFVLAWQIASILRRTLARPILELANTAETVATTQDYGRRAHQYGQDELGQLTLTFNAMLAKTEGAIDALKESEWSHRELVRALPTAAYRCDAQGRITLFNTAAVELWGRTPVIGSECWCGSYQIYRPDGTPLPLDACPMAVALREGRSVRDEEIVIARPDGTRRNVMPYPEPIWDTGGRIVGIVVMLLDITERKTADTAVRQLAAIVESSDDAIIGKDLNGIITSWNRGAEVLFGYTAGQMIGQSVQRLIPTEQKDEESGILARLRLGEPIRYDETIRRRQDGTLVDVSLRISPIKDAGGRIVGASKIARDISERKRAQHQANFLSQLSHQLSSLSDPDAIIRAASRAVGLQLGTDRCYFFTLDESAMRIMINGDWAKEGFDPVSGVHLTSDFGTAELWHALAIESLAIDNKATHPLTRNLGAGYDRLRIGAHASVPFHRKGGWIASLAVTSEKPRVWRKDELSLLENTIVRVWPMVERARSQRELIESERRQSELMRSLPIACYTIDAQGRLTFFNAAAVQLWGQEPKLGVTLWCGSFALVTLDGAPLALEDSPAATALRNKCPVRGIEAFVVRPDGTRRWVAPHPAPIFDTLGNCTGVVNVVMDVTEERTAHGKIQSVAEHLSLAIASANLGDWNWDAATDIITMSPRTAEIYGVSLRPGLTRSQMRNLLHEEDRGRSLLALQHAIETRTDYDVEYRVIRPDGTQRWVAAKGRAFYHGKGRVLGMVGVVQDITERKSQVEELEKLSSQIKTQAQLFDATLSNITDLAYAFDLKGRWIYANRPLLDLWDRKIEQIVGKNCFELGYPPELATRLQAQIQEVIDTKHAVRGETPYVSASGKRDDHEYIFSPVMDASGKVTAVVGTTRLITDRKQAENELKRARDDAMAASRAKDDFLAALSHELRTPLNPVLLLASAAAINPDLPSAIRQDFDLIRKNVDLEARLIDDLLDLTRITRGKLQLDHRRCDLQAILKDALANVQADLQEKRIILVSNFDAVESAVWGDSVRLQQILWNILKNAVKFTPKGGNINITTSSSAQMLTIKIVDTGIGMIPEEIARAFQAFSQGEHAVTGAQLHRFGGLGLGLAISKMLVELHAGQIRASSAGRNQGSTFIIELPLMQGTPGDRPELRRTKTSRRANSLNPFIPSGTRSPIPAPVPRLRILLVEDHAPTLLTLQQLLKCRHFQVTTAKSAAEAHNHALAGEFDLVISDVGLPDRNGYELMADLRTLIPSLPGIALSGYGMEEDLTRSRAAGFSVHLVKPVTINVLEEAIVYLLPSATNGRR